MRQAAFVFIKKALGLCGCRCSPHTWVTHLGQQERLDC